MTFMHKLSCRLALMRDALLIVPARPILDVLNSAYLLLQVLLIYAMWKGVPPLWRAARRRLIFKIESLPYPSQRQWCVPADRLRRWTDPDRVKAINLPRFRNGHPVVYLGIRGVWPVIRKR